MGIKAGITKCCVLSGEAKLDSIKISKYKPDLVINGVWELIDAFNKI
jgi:ribonucleotide monophosphatase NagD (HAD superfamily)